MPKRTKTGEQTGIRPCLDFRALNMETIPITFPIPRVDNLLMSIGKIRVISSLDSALAYHQCTIKKEDRHNSFYI